MMIDPERYESNKSVASREVEIFVPKMIRAMSWVKKRQNILDYGCGAGSTGYHYILPRATFADSKLYSVDISSKMVAYAKEHYADDRIAYAVGNILQEEFPFDKDIKFDKIFSIHVLHFIPNIKKVFDEFQKLLKPDGQFGFTCITINSWIFESWRILGESKMWAKYMKGYEGYLPLWSKYKGTNGREHFQRMLEEGGFNVQELQLQTRSYTYDNIEVFLDFSMSLNPRLECIPRELHPNLKNELQSIMTNLAGIPEDSTSIVYTHEYLYALVEKKVIYDE